MRLFNKVAIVGVGLIGGSIALAIKKKKIAQEVIGVSRHKKTLLLAKKIGAIDRGSQDLNIIKDADLIILATPVETIINLALRLRKVVSPDAIVTDVGSTKQQIVSKLDRIFPKYVGSHPLAGSEKRGVVNADVGIFKDSLCILTPTRITNKVAKAKIEILWDRLGVRLVTLTAQEHDKILSLVSHLPHIVSFSLIGTVPNKYLKFASSGLKDTTRIAGSDSRLWADIFLSNQKNIIKSIELLQENLSRLKSAIKEKDKKRLFNILQVAKGKREILK